MQSKRPSAEVLSGYEVLVSSPVQNQYLRVHGGQLMPCCWRLQRNKIVGKKGRVVLRRIITAEYMYICDSRNSLAASPHPRHLSSFVLRLAIPATGLDHIICQPKISLTAEEVTPPHKFPRSGFSCASLCPSRPVQRFSCTKDNVRITCRHHRRQSLGSAPVQQVTQLSILRGTIVLTFVPQLPLAQVPLSDPPP
jgi:hypothetical protein